ncbi:MAG: hypothetical protein ACP5KZ_07195, partial [bacterium]
RERRRSLRCEWELRSNSQLTPATPFNERGIRRQRGGYSAPNSPFSVIARLPTGKPKHSHICPTFRHCKAIKNEIASSLRSSQ